MMLKLVGIFVGIIATTFYLFPFHFTFAPSVNTKLAMAMVGVLVVLFDLVKNKRRHSKVDGDFLIICLYASVVSLIAFFSVTINNTSDYVYVTYILSFLVWTFAAFVVLKIICLIHGKLSLQLVCYYLVAVCTLQCILAIMVDSISPVKNFIDGICEEAAFFAGHDRLYGLGCGLDVAGGRFSAALIIISFLLLDDTNHVDYRKGYLLFLSFIVIAIIGNMIGRTTTVGLAIALLVLLYSFVKNGTSKQYRSIALGMFIMAMLVSIVLYNSNNSWHQRFEFGFEGFFSLARTGKWEVHSNELLMQGYIFPKTFKTWLIGDGWFGNTILTDPNFVGPTYYGFYMGTDVGYCRFIFYFGLAGLIMFSFFFIKVASTCCSSFSRYRFMFLLLLALNFLVWLKVSTDLYVIMAPFLVLSTMQEVKGGDTVDDNIAYV